MSFPLVKFSQILRLEYGKALPDNERDIDGMYAAYGANGEKTRTNKFLYDKPSIIVGRKGSAGELTLVKDKFWALDVTYYVTHDENKTDLIYLYYALQTKNLTSFARGVKPGINRNDVYELEIPLPPIATQRKIVAKLDAVFAEIDKAKAATEANAKNAEALFQRYLTEVFENAGDDWQAFTVKDLIKIRSGDFLPAKNMISDGLINVYGGNGISGKHNVHNLSGENIIIGRVGAKCGNVRLVSGDIWVTDNAFYVSEYKENINKEFLSVVLELKNLRTLANQMAQPVISFSTIKDAELKIPNSLEAQVEFLKVKNFFELQVEVIKVSCKKKIDLLSLLREATLKQAFSGELVKE